MKLKLLAGEQVKRSLERLMGKHDEFHWAVAWGAANPLSKRLISNSKKFKAVTFGLAFAQTDPNLVGEMVDISGCRVVTKFPSGTYHPKVYAFRSDDRVDAIVGSANFTQGGLGRNHEVSILITGSIEDSFLTEILDFTARSAQLGEKVTQELATRYRLSHRLAAKKLKPPRDPLAELSRTSLKSFSSPIAEMTWTQYLSGVRSSAFHDVEKSLALLQTAQVWFAGVRSFRDLSTPHRKAIAGFIGEGDKAISDQLGQDWAWFGSMRGAGDYMNRVTKNDQYLADAIDSIPQKGSVTKKHFDRFVRLFLKAFENSQRVGGLATASRLLAMKRPDVFLCISKPNLIAAAIGFGFSKSTLTLDNYWERVVEVICASEWYCIEKPLSQDGELWECRAAMLDAMFYRPD